MSGEKPSKFKLHLELRPYYFRRMRTAGLYVLAAIAITAVIASMGKVLQWSAFAYGLSIWLGALAVALPVVRHARSVYGKASDLLRDSKPVKMKVTLNRLAVSTKGKESWMATVTEEDGLRAALKGRQQVMAIDPGSAAVLDSTLQGEHYFDAYCGFDPADPIVVRTPRGPLVLIARADEMLHNEANLNMEQARRHLDKGEFTAASEAATVAIGRDPTYWMAYTFRAHAYASMGMHELALEDFDRAVSLRQTDEDLLYSRGVELVTLGRNKEAMEDFDRVLSIDPDYVAAYFQRTAMFLDREHWAEAVEDLSRVLEIEEENRDALIWRAACYVQQRRYYLAIEDLDRAVELDPLDAQAYRYRAMALTELGEHVRADQDRRRAVELDPDLD